ncbi:MAG TPA: hypothetical protein VM712_01200 [Gaiellales bacterium]|nr:hypothetical protein [Gaiellales bacterium]
MTRVAYIAGAGRSGSTLLAMLLGALPGCVSIGELRHMWRRGIQLNQRCGCGEPFWDCPFWSDVGDHAFGGWDNAPHERMLDLQRQVDRFRQLPRLAAMPVAAGVRRTVDEYAVNAGRVYRAVEQVAQAPTVIDSSKSATFAVILQRVPEIDPVVLHLIRDSRAVAYSWSRRRPMPEVVEGEAYMATYGPARAAIDWARSNVAIEAAHLAGIARTRLRYESLVRAAPEELARVRAALGLTAAQAALLAAPMVEVGVQHTVAGNPARFSGDHVRLRPDEEWMSAMTTRDRRIVAVLTWPMLTAYGYRLRG